MVEKILIVVDQENRSDGDCFFEELQSLLRNNSIDQEVISTSGGGFEKEAGHVNRIIARFPSGSLPPTEGDWHVIRRLLDAGASKLILFAKVDHMMELQSRVMLEEGVTPIVFIPITAQCDWKHQLLTLVLGAPVVPLRPKPLTALREVIHGTKEFIGLIGAIVGTVALINGGMKDVSAQETEKQEVPEDSSKQEPVVEKTPLDE